MMLEIKHLRITISTGGFLKDLTIKTIRFIEIPKDYNPESLAFSFVPIFINKSRNHW